MLIANLIDDLKQHDGQLPVLLASRPSTGSPLAQNEAQVKAIGEVLIDMVGSDVDIRPTNDGRGLVVGQLLELLAGKPEAMNYTVSGIDNEILLPDGQIVRSTIPVLGLLGTSSSVLLLLGSQEQWPSIQFQ